MRLERRIELLEARRRPPSGKPILVLRRPNQSEDDAIREAGVDPSTTTAILLITWGSDPGPLLDAVGP